MEKYTVFKNRKIQHNMDVNSPQIDPCLMQFLSKSQEGVGRQRQVYSKVHLERQRIWSS